METTCIETTELGHGTHLTDGVIVTVKTLVPLKERTCKGSS